MKKINLLILLFLILIPANVFAYELNCDNKRIKYGDTLYCTFKDEKFVPVEIVEGEEEPEIPTYNSISGELKIPSALTCDSVTPVSGLTGNYADNKFLYQGTLNTAEILTIKCTVTEDVQSYVSGQIVVDKFKYQLSTGEKSDSLVVRSVMLTFTPKPTTTTTTKPRNISNSNSLLTSIEEENLDITFSRFVTEYHASVNFEVDKLDLKVKTLNANARVAIKGSQKLELGENIIDIYVTSPDGKATTAYTLYVTRLARGEDIYYEEDDATLSGLTIDGTTFKYDKDVSEYSIYVSNKVDSLKVNPVPTVEDAKVVVTGNESIKDGSVISITVTSKSQKVEKKYLITVHKQGKAKNYVVPLVAGIIIIFIIALIAIIIRVNNRNKTDPIINIKYDKRKMNKGKQMNMDDIPTVDTANTVQPTQPVVETPVAQPTQPVVEAPVAQPTQPVVETPIVQPTQPVAETPVAQPTQPTQPTVETPVAQPVQPQMPIDQNINNNQ